MQHFRLSPHHVCLTMLVTVWCFPALTQPQTLPFTRIVSLSPNTTEILFALGLGDSVVGVTRYCDYPDAVQTRSKVGGYVDPNYEELIALRPDLVVLLTTHHDVERELDKMNISTLAVPYQTLEDVHEAILRIGTMCGRAEQAKDLVRHIQERTEAVRSLTANRERVRVLVCIGRDLTTGSLSGMFVVGRDGFYDAAIQAAGGVNAYQDATIPYPQVSAEGVININPDVIIDLVGDTLPDGVTRDDIVAHWKPLRVTPAVREGQVHVMMENLALRPGPRYPVFLDHLARLLHPELFEETAAHE